MSVPMNGRGLSFITVGGIHLYMVIWLVFIYAYTAKIMSLSLLPLVCKTVKPRKSIQKPKEKAICFDYAVWISSGGLIFVIF